MQPQKRKREALASLHTGVQLRKHEERVPKLFNTTTRTKEKGHRTGSEINRNCTQTEQAKGQKSSVTAGTAFGLLKTA
jgi:hypothetical protein